ncbi:MULTISPECIES: hypothetical protein [Bradyrhizobium]|uniref:hypothetical protein n=1 Tax=Bradyrhizobium centrosematis TaxID=1300039 RepID=UPI0021684146|nr:hypothetical protein [Bradyrhizobium centrosematis]MCS3765678.1 hypothetical protein [Bradyrhizobium centrosematis]MCS3777904.1 hypothetical protein [Bradyrhizobium centrosematis]
MALRFQIPMNALNRLQSQTFQLDGGHGFPQFSGDYGSDAGVMQLLWRNGHMQAR